MQRLGAGVQLVEVLALPNLLVLLEQRDRSLHVELAGEQELDGGRRRNGGHAAAGADSACAGGVGVAVGHVQLVNVVDEFLDGLRVKGNNASAHTHTGEWNARQNVHDKIPVTADRLFASVHANMRAFDCVGARVTLDNRTSDREMRVSSRAGTFYGGPNVCKHRTNVKIPNR